MIDFWVQRRNGEEMLLVGYGGAEQSVPDQIDGVALRVVASAELAAANIWVTNWQRMLHVINTTRTLLSKGRAKSVLGL